MHALARPSVLIRILSALQPFVFLGLVGALGYGLYGALILSPADYQQGETVRIMYVHVPASWMALCVFGFMALNSFFFLVWRHPVADLLAKAAAPIGATFTAISLITGSLWGKPMWGTFWVWDARLTSVLVLFFLYLGYMLLRSSFDNEARASKAAAILALLGAINLPIIKWSVNWWNTLHQPATLTKWGAPSLDPSMMEPLLVMGGAFFLYFLLVLTWRIQGEIYRKKYQREQEMKRHGGRL